MRSIAVSHNMKSCRLTRLKGSQKNPIDDQSLVRGGNETSSKLGVRRPLNCPDVSEVKTKLKQIYKHLSDFRKTCTRILFGISDTRKEPPSAIPSQRLLCHTAHVLRA